LTTTRIRGQDSGADDHNPQRGGDQGEADAGVHGVASETSSLIFHVPVCRSIVTVRFSQADAVLQPYGCGLAGVVVPLSAAYCVFQLQSWTVAVLPSTLVTTGWGMSVPPTTRPSWAIRTSTDTS
jgi:hypothetical protein